MSFLEFISLLCAYDSEFSLHKSSSMSEDPTLRRNMKLNKVRSTSSIDIIVHLAIGDGY